MSLKYIDIVFVHLAHSIDFLILVKISHKYTVSRLSL